MESQLSVNDIKGILRRRKNTSIVIFSVIVAVAVVIARLLPSVYQSKVEILIEGQQIPESLVKSTSTTLADQHLQKIRHEVMSFSNLSKIIKKFNLYPDLVTNGDIQQAVGVLESSVNLETIETRMRFQDITTSFFLTYVGDEPKKVQQVTNELANLYVEVETRARGVRSEATTDFLSEELESMKVTIQEHEQRISEFKAAHIGELPENNAANLQALDRLERAIDENTSRIRSLEEKKLILNGQLASIEPLRPITTDEGQITQNPAEQLKTLRLKLISLQSTLSDRHPDIKKLKSQIKKLEDQVSGEDIINDKILYLKDKETRLSEMRGRYGEKHPDVKKLKREIAILNSEIQKLRTKQIANKNISEQAQPDNPIYINLKTQIVTAETEITNLKLDNVNLEKELKKLQEKVDRSPLVEKEYNDLTLDYNNAKIKYNELLDKLLEAKLSKGMEEKKQGERFTIIAPANLPIRPYKPNRIAIVLMGIVLAVGAVTGYIAVSERLDRTIKDERELASIAGLPILTSLSYIETKEEKKSRRRHYLFIAFSCCFILVIILLILNSLSLTILGLFN